MKKEIRIIAWDDCAFGREQENVRIIGAVFRGSSFMDGLLSTEIEKDGMDVTDKIISAITQSRHYDQLSVIMIDGISFGGLNIADIQKINKKTKLPVIAIQRKEPDIKKFTDALDKLSHPEERKKAVRSAGKVHKHGKTYFQKSGLDEKECEEIIKMTCIRSFVPEPIRVAHLIASGLSRTHKQGFESRGRA